MTPANDGRNAAASARAAMGRLIAGSSRVLIVVDAIDLAGAAAAVRLARGIGASLDHAAPIGLGISRHKGWLGTTPGEAALRADALLIVGPIGEELRGGGLTGRLLAPKAGRVDLRIGARAWTHAGDAGHWLETPQDRLHARLGVLRAVLKGRKPAIDAAERTAIEAFAQPLKSARYGVALFAAGHLDELAVESLIGLVDELSETTRWSVLQAGVPAGQAELVRMTQTLTGLPPPIGFCGARAVHDPWRFDAREMIARGEADLAVWVSASERPVPEWLTQAPRLAALTASPAPLSGVVAELPIGVAGRDHAGILACPDLDGFRALPEAERGERPSAAAAAAALLALAADLGLAKGGVA